MSTLGLTELALSGVSTSKVKVLVTGPDFAEVTKVGFVKISSDVDGIKTDEARIREGAISRLSIANGVISGLLVGKLDYKGNAIDFTQEVKMSGKILQTKDLVTDEVVSTTLRDYTIL